MILLVGNGLGRARLAWARLVLGPFPVLAPGHRERPKSEELRREERKANNHETEGQRLFQSWEGKKNSQRWGSCCPTLGSQVQDLTLETRREVCTGINRNWGTAAETAVVFRGQSRRLGLPKPREFSELI